MKPLCICSMMHTVLTSGMVVAFTRETSDTLRERERERDKCCLPRISIESLGVLKTKYLQEKTFLAFPQTIRRPHLHTVKVPDCMPHRGQHPPRPIRQR